METAHQEALTALQNELGAARNTLDEETEEIQKKLASLRGQHTLMLNEYSSSLLELKKIKKTLFSSVEEVNAPTYHNLFVSLLPFSKKRNFYTSVLSNTRLKEKNINLNLFPGDQLTSPLLKQVVGSLGCGFVSPTYLNSIMPDMKDTALAILISNPLRLASEALRFLMGVDEQDEINLNCFPGNVPFDRDKAFGMIRTEYIPEVLGWFEDWKQYLIKKPNQEIFLIHEEEPFSIDLLRLIMRFNQSIESETLNLRLTDTPRAIFLNKSEQNQIKEMFSSDLTDFFELTL